MKQDVRVIPTEWFENGRIKLLRGTEEARKGHQHPFKLNSTSWVVLTLCDGTFHPSQPKVHILVGESSLRPLCLFTSSIHIEECTFYLHGIIDICMCWIDRRSSSLLAIEFVF